MTGVARELRRVMPHRAPVPFAEGMDGVDLVDVVAEPVEELVSGKAAKAFLRPRIGEQLVQFAREVGNGSEARSTLGDVHGAILARPIVEVLEKVPVE